MAQDRFLIGFADNNSGFQTDYKPWLIADNAFQSLENAYVFRGRVRKRFGSAFMGTSQLNSRLGSRIGTTDSSGDFTGDCPGVEFNIGQLLSIGSELFTIYQTGDPAATYATGSATATFSTNTGEFIVTGAATLTAVYFYPALPVMGITQYYKPDINDYISMAFDTQFSYYYDDSIDRWLQLDAGEVEWTGSDSQFFWCCNYQGITANINLLFATNNNYEDQIRYFDGTTWYKPILNYARGTVIDTTDVSGNASGTLTGTFFIGQVFIIGLTAFTVTAASGALTVSALGVATETGTGTFDTITGDYTFTGAFASNSIYFSGDNYISTSLLIVSFKNRLILLNTNEVVDGTNTVFQNRIRFSGIGSPLGAAIWMQDVPGNGGAIDAPTYEAIVTAQFIKDRLIVYFQSSTYELAYTGNQVIPFTWQKINTELGAESTFSQVPFDKVVLGIGNVGIHACNGANVDRIDVKIPQLVFSFRDANVGVNRVAGIRDYYTELAYWSFPSQDRNDSFYFPNKVLVYNYVNDSWAVNDDSFTCFGYYLFDPTQPGATWEGTLTPWEQNANLWNDSEDSQSTVKFKSVAAGNQEGFVVILRPDILRNAPSLQATDFTINALGSVTIDCINHNLALNDYVLIENMNGLTFTDSDGNDMDSCIGRVAVDPILSATPNAFTIFLLDRFGQAITVTGTYTGGGTIARVSEININTKQYNFYTSNDRNIYIPKVDFLVDKTAIGQITVDFLVSSAGFSFLQEVTNNSLLPGSSVLETSPYLLAPFEKMQSRLWHPLYFYAEGECVALNFYLSTQQMYGYEIAPNGLINFTALQDFQLHAMVFYATPTSSRMQ